MRQGSVLNRFSTGSLETLSIPNIREDLLKFHAEHYSANLMSVALVGRHSLDTLEKLATECFSEVVDKQVRLRQLPVDDIYETPLLVKVVPNKNAKQLGVLWNLPPSHDLWREQPTRVISHLLGHEGPNSLLSQLIGEGLATSLSSGSSFRVQKAMDQLRVSISLTEKGEREYERVLELLYMYINKLKQ